jgi:membrane glycosyltransferase
VNVSTVPPHTRIFRRTVYLILVILTTLGALALLTSSFLQNGITPLELLLLVLYTLLMVWISASFWAATNGFCILLCGDRMAISGVRPEPPEEPGADRKHGRSALVMPIYNEDPKRVFAGLKAVYQSLVETTRADEFDLFILSDTRDPDIWLEEELAWYQLCVEMNAHGKIFYRNREKNISRKSGNLADFCKRWGGRYRYMIVLDADSLMGGATLTKMVDLMEANPRVALLQTAPVPINHESLFARILQFASSLYSTIFTAGIAFWQLSDSNYWGHNAIIRVKPFAQHCGLPKLSGREPFGGEILSHDFVEAALLRKAGWEVWLAYDLKESYEELPPTLIDYAKRDRRWCQGNLQHVRMVFARGISGISRLHFLMGIMSYLSSPLWLLFLVITGIEAYIRTQTMPVYFFGDNIFPVWPESYAVEMTTVLLVTLAMLFLPKILSLLLLFIRGEQVRDYGGVVRVVFSAVLETLFSILTAPVLMLYQSKFVFAILLRRSTGWPAQQRGDHRLGFREAFLAHGGQTFVGLAAGVASYLYVPDFFWWLIPVLAGLVLSIPISIVSSSTRLGRWMRSMGLLLTPEESNPPRIVRLLHDNLSHASPQAAAPVGLHRGVTDPGVCALHLALLPNRPTKKRHRHQLKALIYQLIEDGVENLSVAERRELISDPETLMRLHTLAWSRQDADPKR